VCVKDMRKLGRSLARSVIVDNLPENFALTPDNGIQIGDWKGEKNDRCLITLKEFLVGLATQDPPV
jgi:TFIIF-interacting CTD phosphatase-like protein